MLTRLGRELSQTEGAHYEGGPAVLVPCYYSLQCRLAGRPPSCTLCSEVGGGAIAARLTMCTGTGKVWANRRRTVRWAPGFAWQPPNLQHGHPTWWPRHGHPPKGHRPVLKISRETFSHISPDVCTICIRHTAGGFSQTNSPIWRTGCTPCPRFPNGRPPQPENAGCVPKGSSFGGGVNAIGFLMVNIGLLAYPLHGGRETRELGPKK